MRNITICMLLTVLALTGAAPEARAQQDRAISADTLTMADIRQLTPNERRRERGIMDAKNLFIPKGQWVFGGTASYSTHTNESYNFFVLEGIDSEGYTVRVSPVIGYAIRNNMAVGMRFIYGRTLLKLDNAHLKIGDTDSGIDITTKDFYSLKQTYTVAAIFRQYIPLGDSKRFALFSEVSLGGGGVQAKFANDSPVKGTYQTGYELSLGIAPGIVAFATNNMAVEVNVGVMGITYNSVKQVHNQVSVGRRSSSQMNFKVNLFTIGLGMSFYL